MEHAQRGYKLTPGVKTWERLNPYFNGTCSKSYVTSTSFRGTCNVLILILMEHAQRVAIGEIQNSNNVYVLILILMEHAQREKNGKVTSFFKGSVLILILMEHAQRGASAPKDTSANVVLILILMEHAQRDDASSNAFAKRYVRLNPYFNGTCSKSVKECNGVVPLTVVS